MNRHDPLVVGFVDGAILSDANTVDLVMATSLSKMNIAIMRVYEPVERGDGLRVLVDRLWPRGLSKHAAEIDIWAEELAPSHELRRWFHGDEGNWAGFRTRYRKELSALRPQAEPLRKKIGRGKATFL